LLRGNLRKFKADFKGFSSVIGTIFMVLIVLVLISNVFLWVLSQNTEYFRAMRERNQLELDRLNERLTAENATYTGSEGVIFIEVDVRNECPLFVNLTSLWVFDVNVRKSGVNDALNICLKPGEKLSLRGSKAIKVEISGSNPSHIFNSWFITSRGNVIPLKENIIVAQVAEGIGSIAMDIKQFKYYIPPNDKDGTDIGTPYYSFTLPSDEYTLLCVTLINLDPSHQPINLTKDCYIWGFSTWNPTQVTYCNWYIRKVVNNKLQKFDFQILEYGKPTEVYFGATKASEPPYKVRSGIMPLFILLFGKIGDADYGQNIPFIAVYMTET
jgi:hypothetical protein